jgi:hypothetical protein
MSIASRAFRALAPTGALIATTAIGMTVVPPDFRRLVAEADKVIDGTVSMVRSGIETHDGRPMVYTYVTVEVAETVKGDAAGSVVLRMLGGTAGDLTVHIPGMPRFKTGDRELFFIVGNGSQFCPLVGIGHGLYPVVERGGGVEDVVLRHNLDALRDLNDVSLPLDHMAATGRRLAGDLSGTMTVSEFKRRIREEVDHARSQ